MLRATAASEEFWDCLRLGLGQGGEELGSFGRPSAPNLCRQNHQAGSAALAGESQGMSSLSPALLMPTPPALAAVPGRAVPSLLRADASVVVDGQLCTTKRGLKPSATTSRRSAVHDVEHRQVHVPHENVRGDTGSGFSAHLRSGNFEGETPPTRGSSWRPHRQVREDRGKGSLRRLEQQNAEGLAVHPCGVGER